MTAWCLIIEPDRGGSYLSDLLTLESYTATNYRELCLVWPVSGDSSKMMPTSFAEKIRFYILFLIYNSCSFSTHVLAYIFKKKIVFEIFLFSGRWWICRFICNRKWGMVILFLKISAFCGLCRVECLIGSHGLKTVHDLHNVHSCKIFTQLCLQLGKKRLGKWDSIISVFSKGGLNDGLWCINLSHLMIWICHA